VPWLEELPDTGKPKQFLCRQYGIVRPRLFLSFLLQIIYLPVRLSGS